MSDFLSDYDFQLPERLIAQHPAFPRDSSRLMVIHRYSGQIEHRTFKDIGEYFNSEHAWVVNRSQVIKARLLGHRPTGAKVEFFLLEPHTSQEREISKATVWEGLIKTSASVKEGFEFLIPGNVLGKSKNLRGVIKKDFSHSTFGTVVAEFDEPPLLLEEAQIPLPPYIKRASTQGDLSTYQTLYAKDQGSVAAPTAGLHFTQEVISGLKEKGMDWVEITLHVGLGTFRPVKTENLAEHQMHEERLIISKESAELLNKIRLAHKKIIAVGTTSVRTLESLGTQLKNAQLTELNQKTNLFIRPGHFKFQVVDHLVTNFHLPKSTLFMLVCAFANRDLILKAYQEAIEEEYRFYSYGDAMLIL